MVEILISQLGKDKKEQNSKWELVSAGPMTWKAFHLHFPSIIIYNQMIGNVSIAICSNMLGQNGAKIKAFLKQ
jgi:hypothetical protein